MSNLITPQQIEQAALDIVNFWDSSELPEEDKIKLLTMTKEYYEDRNEHLFDQYLGALCQRTLNAKAPETGFERNE